MKTLTRTQFAAELGVAGSTITRWAQAGRLVFVDTKKIDVEASKRRLQATEDPAPHLAARRAQLAEARQARKTQNAGVGDHAGAENAATASAEAANGIDGLEIESIGLEMKRARLKTERYKAEQAQIEVEKLRGTLVERSNVDYTVESLARSVQNLSERFADQQAPALAGMAGDSGAIHAHLTEAMRDLRTELATQIQRTMETL